jgi:hypothetical protein
MRTTLALEDDAVEAIASYAKGQRISLGKAASELIRRGSGFRLGTRQVNGLPVFEVPDHFPKITSEQVRQLLDEE